MVNPTTKITNLEHQNSGGNVKNLKVLQFIEGTPNGVDFVQGSDTRAMTPVRGVQRAVHHNHDTRSSLSEPITTSRKPKNRGRFQNPLAIVPVKENVIPLLDVSL